MKDQLTVSASFIEDLSEQVKTLKDQIANEQRQSQFWEDAHTTLEEKLRIEYDAELEAFKTVAEERIRLEYEDKFTNAFHAGDEEIKGLRDELEKRDMSIKNLLQINKKLNEEIKAQQEIANLQYVLKKRLEKAERDINDIRHNNES
jgi:HPt (histidine-containing phosphotransfer) domain-containing protein